MTATLLSLATAVPPFVLDQAAVAERAKRLFALPEQHWARMAPVYAHAEIETRYSCVPISWYLQGHKPGERNQLYIHHALALLQQAAERALQQAELSAQDIDSLILVSSTGIATPSLDARLMNHMNFRADVQRSPLFGLGCAGGVVGLGRTAQLAESRPGTLHLLLVVELCGLTFRANDISKSNIIATALFGDGAAAAVVVHPPVGDHQAHIPSGQLRIIANGEHTWPESLDIMGWEVADDGWGVVFSRDIPRWIEARFAAAAEAFLARQGYALGDLQGFICHPGGAKVITALEEIFGAGAFGLRHARQVLRDFGNMSAPTVLFVLQAALQDAPPGTYLLAALGPGFSVGFVLVERL